MNDGISFGWKSKQWFPSRCPLIATALLLLAASGAWAADKPSAPDSAPAPSDGATPCPIDSIPHPRVLVTESRLEFLRNDIKTNAVRRAIYEKDVKANADRWLNRAIVIPEVSVGWTDFRGPDGVLLEIPKDQKFDPNVPSRSLSMGKSYLNEKILVARRCFEHLWLTFAVRDLGLAYAMSQRREYADKAAEILLKYTDAYPHFIAESNVFGINNNSLGDSMELIPMAQGYDLIYNSGALSDEQKRHVERDFFWPEAQRPVTVPGARGNWGSWHLSAVGVIGYATGHQRFIDYGINNFKAQIRDYLGDDGLWPESASSYHFFPLDAFLSFAGAAGNCGEDLFHWQAKPGKSLESMFDAPLHYMYPTLQLPAINDGWYDSWLPEDQYTAAAWQYRKPEFAWAARRSIEVGRQGFQSTFYDQRYRLFLFGESSPEPIPPPVFGSTNFPVLGIAILRQGSKIPADREMFLTFHYGPWMGHGQLDKMGVTLFANGQPIAPGLGYQGTPGHNYDYFYGVTSHNTIAIDEKNQPRTKDGGLIAFRDEPQLKLAAAETEQAVPGTKWIRAVLLADNYAVIWDDLRGERPHTFDWFFHAEGTNLLLTGVSTNRPADTRKRGEFPYPLMKGARAQQLAGPAAEANWLTTNAMGLKIWMMGETNDSLFSANCPGPVDGKTIPVIALRKISRDCQFASVLQPWADKPADIKIHADRSDLGVLRLTISQPARTDVISFHPRQIEFDYDAGGPRQKQLDVPLSSSAIQN